MGKYMSDKDTMLLDYAKSVADKVQDLIVTSSRESSPYKGALIKGAKDELAQAIFDLIEFATPSYNHDLPGEEE